jgi:uncharacterized protein YodC (DUF2158 family)
MLWKIGDSVQFPIGGPKMLVKDLLDDQDGFIRFIVCQWFDSIGIFHEESFIPSVLISAGNNVLSSAEQDRLSNAPKEGA